MLDQYFGVKELYEVVLRAKTPMVFGNRQIEAEEPVLYFENVSMASMSESNMPTMARGGWANMPRVIWDNRSEITFTLSEGVMSSVGMSILLSANVTSNVPQTGLLINKREGPIIPEHLEIDGITYTGAYLSHLPVLWPQKKVFIFEYTRDAIQKKVYGKIIERNDPFDSNSKLYFLAIYEDKNLTTPVQTTKKYLVDYYYEYRDEALLYSVKKERFNGLFTLEGKFYSKDENEGINYTNLIYMPRVRVVSDINLRLGERASPTVSVFNVVGLPETLDTERQNVIMEIYRLNNDLEEEL